MARYMVTMGLQYKREPHPYLSAEHANPDGWLLVEADNEINAREKVRAVIGNRYSFLYTESDFEPKWFPDGCVGEIVVGVFPPSEAF